MKALMKIQAQVERATDIGDETEHFSETTREVVSSKRFWSQTYNQWLYRRVVKHTYSISARARRLYGNSFRVNREKMLVCDRIRLDHT